MNRSHDALQHYLEQLEAGISLDDILDKLPDEHVELAALLSIAHALRQAPEPPRDPARAATRDGAIAVAIGASQGARAAPKPRDEPNSGRPRIDRRKWRLPSLNFVPQFQFSGALVAFLLVGVAFWILLVNGDAAHETALATVRESSGDVEVAGIAVAGWQSPVPGAALTAGQKIRTGASSSATLAFFDGSELYLAPASEVSILTLDRQKDSLSVEIAQHVGQTMHDVVPLQGENAAYVVETPGGTVTVHGTLFSVSVDRNGRSQIAVDRGEVTVTAAGESLALTGGQSTDVFLGEPPAQPEQPPTPTATPTATSTPIATATQTPEATAMPGATDCTGADPHPQGVRLANRNGVSSAEIMSWFCAGFGFGEIEIVYGLSARTGRSVGDIFDMRTSGMGWGQIRHELGDLHGGPPEGAGSPGGGAPPDHVRPPEGAGPPDLVGPPDNVGPPDHAGKPPGGSP